MLKSTIRNFLYFVFIFLFVTTASAVEKKGLSITKYYGYFSLVVVVILYYLYEKSNINSKKSFKPHGILFINFVFLLLLGGIESAYHDVETQGKSPESGKKPLIIEPQLRS